MAASYGSSPSKAKRESLADRSERFKAEQVRLKEEAAARRAAAAAREAGGDAPAEKRRPWSTR